MSTNVKGAYMPEDEKKKLKEESGGSAPLSYEGFVGSGMGSSAYKQGAGYIQGAYDTTIGALEANKALGSAYAQDYKNNAYASAEELRKQTDENTRIARERGIIDSRSSYQKAIGAYGANAEALASRGLSGGYGEYMNANAYATHRGQVQDINAEALRANREAAYIEQQSKDAADAAYLQKQYEIQSAYNTGKAQAENDKASGLYEIGVGLESDKAKAYADLLASAQGGATLESIQNDARWGDLTPEQQAVIGNAVSAYNTNKSDTEKKAKESENFNTAMGLLDSGWTIDEVKAYFGGDLKAALGAGASQVEQAASVINRVKTETAEKDASGALTDYIDLAMQGVPIATIEAIARSYGHYDTLNSGGLWASVTKEAKNYADKQKADTNKQTVQDMIDGGYTAEEIKGSDAYKGLDTETKSEVDKIINKNEEQVQANIDSIVESFSDVQSLDEVESILKGEAVPESERGKIISAWQENNVDKAKKGIKDGTLTSETIVQNVKNGMYGDGGASVATEYAKSLLAELNGEGVDVVDVLNVKDDLDNLDGIVSVEWWNRIQTTIASKMTNSTGKVENSGTGYAIEGKKVSRFENLDKSVTDMLENKYPNVSGMTYVKIGDEYFAYMGNRWKKATMK
jgi:hypothetical protein